MLFIYLFLLKLQFQYLLHICRRSTHNREFLKDIGKVFSLSMHGNYIFIHNCLFCEMGKPQLNELPISRNGQVSYLFHEWAKSMPISRNGQFRGLDVTNTLVSSAPRTTHDNNRNKALDMM